MGTDQRLNPQVRIQLLARIIRRGVACAICVVPCWYAIACARPGQVSDMADSLASVAGVLAGFVLAALTALYALGKTSLMSALKQSGHLQFLVLESICCVALFTAAAVLSIAVRLLDGQPFTVWVATASVYFGLAGIVFLVAVSVKHYRVLTIIQE